MSASVIVCVIAGVAGVTAGWLWRDHRARREMREVSEQWRSEIGRAQADAAAARLAPDPGDGAGDGCDG